MWRGVESNFLWKFASFAVHFQERVDKGTCAAFSFGTRNVDDIKTIDIIVLDLYSTCFQSHLQPGVATECPNPCNHSLTPTKLGVPFRVGVPLELGIETRPLTLLASGEANTLGLACLRLLLRSATAFCSGSDECGLGFASLYVPHKTSPLAESWDDSNPYSFRADHDALEDS